MNASCLRPPPRPAPPASLGRNSRLEKFFLDARMWHVFSNVSRLRRWGSDGASLESVSGFSQDPISYWAGDFNLYRYCGDNPTAFVDPSGLDFIAIADRRVSGSMGAGYHYSVEYWKSCKKFEPLNDTKGYSEAEILKKNPDATKEAAVELLADTGWTVWGGWTPRVSGAKYWDKASVWVAVIHYSDTASKIMPIFDDSPKVVKEKWDKIISTAKGYSWAEQDGFGGTFVNWPRSLYMTYQTNSNTFARYVVKSAGLTFVEMSGNHPGNNDPSQNTYSRYTFYATQTPWQGGEGNPKPSGDPE